MLPALAELVVNHDTPLDSLGLTGCAQLVTIVDSPHIFHQHINLNPLGVSREEHLITDFFPILSSQVLQINIEMTAVMSLQCLEPFIMVLIFDIGTVEDIAMILPNLLHRLRIIQQNFLCDVRCHIQQVCSPKQRKTAISLSLSANRLHLLKLWEDLVGHPLNSVVFLGRLPPLSNRSVKIIGGNLWQILGLAG